MKRCLFAAAASILLALTAGVGAARADLAPIAPPILEEPHSQTASNEGQESTQSNSATVTNTQGNGNVNAPVQVTVVGDNSNHATQGSGNSAPTVVEQSNTNDQTQKNEQTQTATSSGGCCHHPGASQSGRQSASNEEQKNDQSNSATVVNTQGNGNVNAPVQVTVIGDNSNHATQGSHNSAPTQVEQSNESTQTQKNEQTQTATSRSGRCCASGTSQSGTQEASNEKQESQQSNSATVVNMQGNGNVNAPVQVTVVGDNRNHATQGSHNSAPTTIDQSNSSEQKQVNRQSQDLSQPGSGCCESSGSQHAQQSASNDEQSSNQSNSASVTNTQGNGNVNAPVQTSGGRIVLDSICCNGGHSGNSNHATQGSYNSAPTTIEQSNQSRQVQANRQQQTLSDHGGCCRPKPRPCESRCGEEQRHSACCGGSDGQSATQSASNSGQHNQQSNYATVTNTQGNENVNTPVQTGGGAVGTASRCGGCDGGGGNSSYAKQGSHNSAPTSISQSNESRQVQANHQQQDLSRRGGCCRPHPRPCESKCGYEKPRCESKCGETPRCEPRCGNEQPTRCESTCEYEPRQCCADGQSAAQEASNSDQSSSQSNSATVTNTQGNNNVNAPVQTSGGGFAVDSICCGGGGGNSSYAKQGSYNSAPTTIRQSNVSDQTQRNTQRQNLVQGVREACGI